MFTRNKTKRNYTVLWIIPRLFVFAYLVSKEMLPHLTSKDTQKPRRHYRFHTTIWTYEWSRYDIEWSFNIATDINILKFKNWMGIEYQNDFPDNKYNVHLIFFKAFYGLKRNLKFISGVGTWWWSQGWIFHNISWKQNQMVLQCHRCHQ